MLVSTWLVQESWRGERRFLTVSFLRPLLPQFVVVCNNLLVLFPGSFVLLRSVSCLSFGRTRSTFKKIEKH